MDLINQKKTKETSQEKLPFRSLMEPLLVLFNKAVYDIFANRDYYIAYSIPGGVYGYFKDGAIHNQDVEKIRQRLKELIKDNLNFQQELLPKENRE